MRATLIFELSVAAVAAVGAENTARGWAPLPLGITYTNQHIAEVPWSIHVVRFERAERRLELHSAHAGNRALGLSTLSSQVARFDPTLGVPIAALNGDFYQRNRAYAGDPRELQIVCGELISGPQGGSSFWIDAAGLPHATNVTSRFQMRWPKGELVPLRLNGDRATDEIMLYTPAIGPSTRSSGGRELILEGVEQRPWLPLRIGEAYAARVREIRTGGDAPLSPETMVISLGPAAARAAPSIEPGAVVRIFTGTAPDLRGATEAIGGGPILVRKGRRQRIQPRDLEGYESTSMLERHPRSAIGWSQTAFFLVEVDGRQRTLSVGMTLDELAQYMLKLGCEEAMSLDGGGSATLWYDGRVRNRPCDGHERVIANSLIVAVRDAPPPSPSAAMHRPQTP